MYEAFLGGAMPIDEAIGEFADMLQVASVALQRLISQDAVSDDNAQLPLIEEVEQIAHRLAQIAEKLFAI